MSSSIALTLVLYIFLVAGVMHGLIWILGMVTRAWDSRTTERLTRRRISRLIDLQERNPR